MLATMPTPCDAAASLLAIVVSANGRIDAREVAELDRLRAYRRLGIQRESFMTLVMGRQAIAAMLAEPPARGCTDPGLRQLTTG